MQEAGDTSQDVSNMLHPIQVQPVPSVANRRSATPCYMDVKGYLGPCFGLF